ncbi:MAG: hypothetical protein K2X03_09265 [Bryobacteraceae bacterium]|nr:hypothetical protein [Bryobacteraceae bacterium]
MNPFLRHTVAALAFRFRKAVKDAPPGFGDVSAGAGARTATQTVAHMGDLFDWALSHCDGAGTWHEAVPQGWDAECARFLATLEAFDKRLQSPLQCEPERLFQGPVADALTHVGQLGTLRRLAESPVGPKNYFKADIAAGTI